MMNICRTNFREYINVILETFFRNFELYKSRTVRIKSTYEYFL